MLERLFRDAGARLLRITTACTVLVALAAPGFVQRSSAQPISIPPNLILGARASSQIFSGPPNPAASQPTHVPPAPASTGPIPQSLTCTPPAAANEIVALARALKWNPDLIYEYVHNNIATIPIYDSMKGALGALIDQAGTPVDQAELMFALLQQSCFSPQYQVGMIFLTAAQLDEWLGTSAAVPNNPNQAFTITVILASNGFCTTATPSSCDGGGVYTDANSQVVGADVPWIWVSVPIGGTTYQFDPASKIFPNNGGDGYLPRSRGLGASLPAALGYLQSSFLADARNGATGIGSPAIAFSGSGRTQLRSDLSRFSNNLVGYLRAANPTATTTDVIGGGVIALLPTYTPPTSGPTTWGQTSLLYPNGQGIPPTTTGSLSAFRTTLTLTLGYNDASNNFTQLASPVTYNSSDIYGHRLAVRFDATTNLPSLLLDGTTQATASATVPSGRQLTVRVAITHPHLPCDSLPIPSGCSGGPGPNIDNVRVTPGPGAIYVIGTGWGGAARGMIEKHRKLLQQNILLGQAATSESVLGESLSMIGSTWLAEYTLAQQVIGELSGTTVTYLHAVGVIGMRAVGSSQGPFVDLPLNTVTVIQRQSRPSDLLVTPAEGSAFFTIAIMGSVLESGTLEQTQPKDANGNPTVAASTVKVLDIWSTAGTIYDLNDPTIAGDNCLYYGTNVRSHLVNFTAQDLARIDSLLGYIPSINACTFPFTTTQVLVPSNGQISVGLWSGTGYIQILNGAQQASQIGMIITGGLSGGDSGSEIPPVDTNTNQGFGTLNPDTGQFLSPPSQTSDSVSSPQNTNISTSGGGSSSAQPLGGDPIALVTGSYVYKHDDISVGSGDFPTTLALTRSYDSGLGQIGKNSSSLGNGWMHNYDVTALPDSDGFEGMGQNSPISGAPTIAALYIIQDILNLQTSTAKPADRIIIAAQAARWLMDQLTGNVVQVTRAGSVERFVLLPSDQGTKVYNAPFGSSSVLTGAADTGYTETTKTGEILVFNPLSAAAAGRIARSASPSGWAVNFVYNASGQLQSVQNLAAQRQLNFQYNAANQLASVDDNNGRAVSYTYDTQGNLQTFSDPLQFRTAFAYAGIGLLTQIFYPTNAGTPFVSTTYDVLGRPFQQADALGNPTVLYFAGTRTETVDSVGTARVTYFSARGKALASIEGLGSPTINGGAGNKTTTTYDGLDRPISVTLPEGGTTTIAYDATVNPLANNIASITRNPKPGSPLSALTTRFSYDPIWNKPTSIIDPLGLVTAMSYDPGTGNLVQTTADPGHSRATSRFTYNGVGQVLTRTDPLGIVTLFGYDGFGNLAAVTRDYGSVGHLNQRTTINYDSPGNVAGSIDPKGNVTTNIYDANRRLVASSAPAAPAAPNPLVTTFTYTPDGLLLQTARSIAGARLTSTNISYTPTNKVATAVDANNKVLRYTYDADDRLAAVTDPLGRVTSYGYDALSRRISVSNAAIQAGPLLQQSYTPDGLIASLTDANNHATSFTYDGFDRLSTSAYPDGSTEVLGYDADGNVLTRKTRAGQTITFTYDTLNRPASKAAPSEPTVSYAYDLLGRMIAASDDSAAITRLATSASYASTLSYDQLNRPVGVSWTPAPVQGTRPATSASFAFGYDATNRRISQSATDNSWWGYPTTAKNVSYSANNLNQYTAVGAVTPTYDGNGNLTSDGTFTFGYDAENRLISASGVGMSATYVYDAQGRRKSKTVNGTTTVFVTEFANREILEYAGATGALQNWYAYGLGPNEALNQMNVASNTRATLIPDVQGSFVGSFDASTGTLTKFGYQAYGESASTGGSFRYTGQRIDPETNGLYYYRARMYAPGWGRFMQVDPIGYAGGTSLYAYVDNDPLSRLDPYGTDPLIGTTVGFVAGAYYGALGAAFAPGASFKSIVAGAGIGGLAGAAIGFLDPSIGIGTLALIGAGAGGVGDVVGQVVTNYASGNPLWNINYGSTAGAIAGGALSGVGGAALVKLAPAAIPEVISALGAASISGGPGTILTATGAALGEALQTNETNETATPKK